MSPNPTHRVLDMPPPQQSAPLLISEVEAARLLGISRAHLHRLRAAGKFIEATRLGRKLLFSRAELEAWTAAKCPDLATWRAMQAAPSRRLRIVR